MPATPRALRVHPCAEIWGRAQKSLQRRAPTHPAPSYPFCPSPRFLDPALKTPPPPCSSEPEPTPEAHCLNSGRAGLSGFRSLHSRTPHHPTHSPAPSIACRPPPPGSPGSLHSPGLSPALRIPADFSLPLPGRLASSSSSPAAWPGWARCSWPPPWARCSASRCWPPLSPATTGTSWRWRTPASSAAAPSSCPRTPGSGAPAKVRDASDAPHPVSLPAAPLGPSSWSPGPSRFVLGSRPLPQGACPP